MRALPPWSPITKGGFTLIELVVVISLSSLFLASFSLLLSTSFDAFFLNKDVNSSTLELRSAFERIELELRRVPSNSSTDLNIGNANELNFKDANGNNIRYWLNGGALYRNTDVIAANISALNVDYLNRDLNSTASVSTDTYCIRIRVDALLGSQGRQYQTTVYLRKLP